LAGVREATASAATWTPTPRARRSRADEHLVATLEVEALGPGGGEDGLGMAFDAVEVRGDLGDRVAQAARVLLGDHDGQAERASPLDEDRDLAGDVVEARHRLAEGLLDVDDHQRGARAVERGGAHAHEGAPPCRGAAVTANPRSR
jgi:hypothetical protein